MTVEFRPVKINDIDAIVEEKALRILLKFRLSFPIILFLKVSV